MRLQILLNAAVTDMDARRKVNPRRRGRRPDVMTPALAPDLLGYFLRNNNSSGRHSVIVTVDGKKKQEEAGPLFEFFKEAIQPVNQYLISTRPQAPLTGALGAVCVARAQTPACLAEHR